MGRFLLRIWLGLTKVLLLLFHITHHIVGTASKIFFVMFRPEIPPIRVPT